jgi:hypothetical protein
MPGFGQSVHDEFRRPRNATGIQQIAETEHRTLAVSSSALSARRAGFIYEKAVELRALIVARCFVHYGRDLLAGCVVAGTTRHHASAPAVRPHATIARLKR